MTDARSPTAHSATPRALTAWLAAGLAVAALTACGGGGGGGGGPTTPRPSVVFTASGVAGPDALVLRQGPGTDSTRLVLELAAEDLTAVYGVAFDLRYPVSVLTFDAATAEDFLGQDGNDPILQMAEQPAGNLVVGLTRRGQVPGIAGNGVLLTLTFRIVAGGSGSFEFDANQAFDAAGDPLPAVSWGAGSVQVVR